LHLSTPPPSPHISILIIKAVLYRGITIFSAYILPRQRPVKLFRGYRRFHWKVRELWKTNSPFRCEIAREKQTFALYAGAAKAEQINYAREWYERQSPETAQPYD